MILKEEDVAFQKGKHAGKKLKDIPHDYLLWCLDNFENLFPPLKGYILLHEEEWRAEGTKFYKVNKSHRGKF